MPISSDLPLLIAGHCAWSANRQRTYQHTPLPFEQATLRRRGIVSFVDSKGGPYADLSLSDHRQGRTQQH